MYREHSTLVSYRPRSRHGSLLRPGITLALLTAWVSACGDDSSSGGKPKGFAFSVEAAGTCSDYFGDVEKSVLDRADGFGATLEPCSQEGVVGSCDAGMIGPYETRQILHYYGGDPEKRMKACESGEGTWHESYYVP